MRKIPYDVMLRILQRITGSAYPDADDYQHSSVSVATVQAGGYLIGVNLQLNAQIR